MTEGSLPWEDWERWTLEHRFLPPLLLEQLLEVLLLPLAAAAAADGRVLVEDESLDALQEDESRLLPPRDWPQLPVLLGV